MEKIMVLFNPDQPTAYTIDFACQMAKMTKAVLTGIFVEQAYVEFSPVMFMESLPHGGFPMETTTGKKGLADTDQALRLFREKCAKNYIACNVLRDKGEPVQEIIFESRYADLIIVDPSLHFFEGSDTIPSHFVKQLLAHAESPVLLAPEHCTYLDEIIFCYNGTASSMYAIRQFTYMLPELKDCKVSVLEISKNDKPEFNEGHKRLMDWLRMHYDSVRYQVVTGNAADELFTHLFMHHDKMVVIGAYGRNMLSRLFRKSTADKLVRMVDLPIFITHH
jgi:hypothetical protein